MEFKNYKEKQAYYRNRAKQETLVWESSAPKTKDGKKNPLIKGKTYINHEKRKKR